MNKYVIPALLGATALAVPAGAQSMPGTNMPGMTMPAPKAKAKKTAKPVRKVVKRKASKAKLPLHAGHKAQPAPSPVPAPMTMPMPVPAAPTSAPTPAGQTDHGAMDMGGMAMPPMAPSGSPAPAPMAGMDHSGHSMAGMEDDDGYQAQMSGSRIITFSEGSGTSRLPGTETMHGRHIMAGDWMVMLHGTASLQYTDVSGPRGDSKTYVTSMAMVTGEKETGWGRIQLKSMFSLEPAMSHDGYPNLFATGETAYGQPLVDRQHPHDLFMELAARVDVNVWNGSLYLYGGPVGEPALGPSAFMHRASASNNPEPPITHHWFDSTHITYGVVTVGYSAPKFQIEASAFRGQEPDERRWNIETPKLDSWSVRATYNPTANWAIQASYGQLKQPEANHPGENEHRFTASAHYAKGGFSAMAGFSAKKRVPGETLTAWLGEANWNVDSHNSLFGRIENVNNDELLPDPLSPLHDQPFRVTKFQAGYARHLPVGPFDLALGGSLSAYAKPAALDPYYGNNPIGYTLFMRVSLGH